jgi:cytochrome c-type biogenesis protein CcmH
LAAPRLTRLRTIALFGVLALGGALALISTSPTERRPSAYALSYEIMSPFCPGLTLAACPSSQAQDLREQIARRVEAGETHEAIMRDLVSRYGAGVRAAPEATGSGLVVWLLPIALGAVVLIVVIANVSVGRSRRTPDPATPAVTHDTGLSRRLDDELAALD